MIIYIILIIISLILFGLRNSIAYNNAILRKLILASVIMLLLALTIFRGITVGTDYMAYNSYYYSSSAELKMQYIENGYILLNSLARSLNLFIIIPMLEFAISFFGMFSLAKVSKCNDFSFVSMYILTYTYMQSFNTLRQFIAMGFISFGCTFLFRDRKGKTLWFLLFILLACQFHSSSLIMLIIPLFMKFHVTSTKVFISGIVTTILFATGLGIKITQPLIMMNGHYATKYSDSITFLTSSGNKGIIQFLPVIIQFILFYFYLFLNREDKDLFYLKSQKYNLIFTGYLIFLILYSAGGNGVIDRIQMFLFVFCIIANCYFVDKTVIRSVNLKMLYQLLVIGFWVLYCVLRLVINNAGIVPYILG